MFPLSCAPPFIVLDSTSWRKWSHDEASIVAIWPRMDSMLCVGLSMSENRRRKRRLAESTS